MKRLRWLLLDTKAASAAEYALILGIIGAGIALASMALGNTISSAMTTASERITDCC